MANIIVSNKQHYTDIANAIRRKNGNQNQQYYPYEMSQAILDIGHNYRIPNTHDIMNHGEYDLLNTKYYDPTLSLRYDYRVPKMEMTGAGAGKIAALSFPFLKDSYQYIKIECEARTMSNNSPIQVFVGARNLNNMYLGNSGIEISDALVYGSYDPNKPFDVCSESLIDNDNKIFSRSLVTLSLEDADPGFYYISVLTRFCDYFAIYSIWLE